MKSTLHKTGMSVVVTVHEDDFFDAGFGLQALQDVEKLSVKKVVFDLSNIEVMQSRDVKYLGEIIRLFELSGKVGAVSGFNPVTVTSLIGFLDSCNFKIYLNVEEALVGD